MMTRMQKKYGVLALVLLLAGVALVSRFSGLQLSSSVTSTSIPAVQMVDVLPIAGGTKVGWKYLSSTVPESFIVYWKQGGAQSTSVTASYVVPFNIQKTEYIETILLPDVTKTYGIGIATRMGNYTSTILWKDVQPLPLPKNTTTGGGTSQPVVPNTAEPAAGYEFTQEIQQGCTFSVVAPEGTKILEKKDVPLVVTFGQNSLVQQAGRTFVARLYDEGKNMIAQCGGSTSADFQGCPLTYPAIESTKKYFVGGYITSNVEDRTQGKPYIAQRCGVDFLKEGTITKLDTSTPLDITTITLTGAVLPNAETGVFASAHIGLSASIVSDFPLDSCSAKNENGKVVMQWSRDVCRSLMEGKYVPLSPYILPIAGSQTFSLFVQNVIGQTKEKSFTVKTDTSLPFVRFAQIEHPSSFIPQNTCSEATPTCQYGSYAIVPDTQLRDIPEYTTATLPKVAMVCYPGDSTCAQGKVSLLVNSTKTSCEQIPDDSYVSCTLSSDPKGCYVPHILSMDVLKGKILTMCGKVLTSGGRVAYSDLYSLQFRDPGTSSTSPTNPINSQGTYSQIASPTLAENNTRLVYKIGILKPFFGRFYVKNTITNEQEMFAKDFVQGDTYVSTGALPLQAGHVFQAWMDIPTATGSVLEYAPQLFFMPSQAAVMQDVTEYVLFDTPTILKNAPTMKVTLAGQGKRYVATSVPVEAKISLRKILTHMAIMGTIPYARIPVGPYTMTLESTNNIVYDTQIIIPPYYFDPSGDLNGDGKGYDVTDRLFFLMGSSQGKYATAADKAIQSQLQQEFIRRAGLWFLDFLRS